MKNNCSNKPHLGRNIAFLRGLKSMKQSALASALGVSQQAISKMEKSADLSHKLLEVAEVLNVPVDLIQSFTEERFFRQ